MIPEGFEARPATLEDAAETALIINAAEAVHCAEVTDHMSEDGMRDWLGGYDLATETTVVRTNGGLVALGMLEVRGDVLGHDGFVDPAWAGRGLGGHLVSWAEGEARRRGLSRVRSAYLAADTGAEGLFRGRGYSYVRTFYRMIADLDAPPVSAWPEGFALSTLEPGGETAFRLVLQEAFAGSFGYIERPLDEWVERYRRESPEPALWFLAAEGGEPAAALLASQSFGMGWIGLLGTRPAFRHRGLGRALLLHAFAELYARGERRMGLGVDATNETGATRLYESAGMRVAWKADCCESPPL